MGTFNSFAQNAVAKCNGGVPVWLGTVTPVPVGGVLESDAAFAGAYYPAGTPVLLSSGKIRPFIPFKVLSVDSSNHIITVSDCLGYLPAVGQYLGIFDGASFDSTTAIGKVSAVAANATAGWDITMTDGKLDSVTAGKFLAATSETAVAASGKKIYGVNGYLYNDIRIDKAQGRVSVSNADASGSVVMSHAEGILILRTIGADFKAALKAAIPNVIQVEY